MEDEVRECGICGGDVWDNRDRKRGNQPDYKCKDKNCDAAAWINDDGSVGWKEGRPQQRGNNRGGGYRRNGSDQRAPARQSSNGGMSKDDYWNRKEERELEGQKRQGRAHSQEMALRYLALKGEPPKTTGDLRKVIDWFQADLDNGGKTAKPAPAPAELEPELDEEESLTL